MNEFRFICARLILDERVLKILSVTERHIQSICGCQVLHYNLYFLKQCQIVVCKLKSVLVCINFMHHDASMAKCDNGYRSRDYQ